MIRICAQQFAGSGRERRWMDWLENLAPKIHSGRRCRCVCDLFRRIQFYSKVVPTVLPAAYQMKRAFWPVLNTILFTVLVPGTVAVYVPWRIVRGFSRLAPGALTWLGVIVLLLGGVIYFRCAWEFAVRGLGTPAPIAPTKYLVTTALHRHVRNPMYIGVALVILGEATVFRSFHVAEYAVVMLFVAHLFVMF